MSSVGEGGEGSGEKGTFNIENNCNCLRLRTDCWDAQKGNVVLRGVKDCRRWESNPMKEQRKEGKYQNQHFFHEQQQIRRLGYFLSTLLLLYPVALSFCIKLSLSLFPVPLTGWSPSLTLWACRLNVFVCCYFLFFVWFSLCFRRHCLIRFCFSLVVVVVVFAFLFLFLVWTMEICQQINV